MIRSSADYPEGLTLRTDVLVIGSGAGGGVVAAVLAEGGREVVVVEEGEHVPRERMTQREDEMYPLLYRDGGNQFTHDGQISVLQGRVVGGSTVVNMADVVGVPAEVRAHWRTHHGWTRYADADWAEAEADCRRTIGANRIPRSALNRNNEGLMRGGERSGFAVDTMEHNRVGCLGSGYCLIGCAYDAKRSVALSFLPRAFATGRASVVSEARIDRLESESGTITGAVGHFVRRVDGALLAPIRITADHYVVAAGAVHSPLLLLASGLGGSATGRNLTLQPQVPVAAMMPDDVVMFRGIPQAAFVDRETATEDEGLGGYRIEAVSATPGMAALTTALRTADLHRFMSKYRQVSAALCLVPDRPTGRITRNDRGRPQISYELTPEVRDRLRDAIVTAATCWFAAGAEAVVLPFADAPLWTSPPDKRDLEGFALRSGSTPMISAHPQGTCRLGPDPASAVAGLDGRVHGVTNLSVLDASVFPTSASSHTQLPVMSIAWLAARELL